MGSRKRQLQPGEYYYIQDVIEEYSKSQNKKDKQIASWLRELAKYRSFSTKFRRIAEEMNTLANRAEAETKAYVYSHNYHRGMNSIGYGYNNEPMNNIPNGFSNHKF